MSTLLVETLYDKLEQEIRYDGKNRVSMAAFIPYLYFHNVAGAIFKFEIVKNTEVLFEQNFTSEDISTALNANYAHVFYPIVPLNPIQLESGTYIFRISKVSGYEVGESFLGWIRQYQDTQNEMDYTPSVGSELTFAIRFKQYQEGIYL